MKDYEAVTLKAFLAALANQSAPLPAEIQTQLNQSSANHDQHIAQLDAIARQNPDLKEPYLTARKLLDSPQERNKGTRVKPNAVDELQNPESLTLDNISHFRDETPLESYVKQLIKTDDQTLSKVTTSILESANSVEAAPWFIFNLPS
ncbi:hypothetical protein [Pseudanabaena sp. BC1403]|uniref:hypothetical protein n=1 Tax=Pseudanabaena sp. BC1403 TaxID=2043171 RepID=UPI000CD95223|nr:hypothetical protein [Pseudanabaena sp. BC1403]